MNQRWRTLLRPSAPYETATPHAGEAVAAWVLGTAWAFGCLWLWRLGLPELLPATLLGALLALWGWRSDRWLHWLPPVAVGASLLELIVPLAPRAAGLVPGYVGLVAVIAVLLACVRVLAVGRIPIAGRPVEVAASLLGALGLGFALVSAGLGLQACASGLVIFGAALAMAARPTGERRVWIAFPLTATLIGLHALIVQAGGGDGLLEQSAFADRAMHVPHGLLQLLLVSLPVCLGLAIESGTRLRRFSRVAVVLGGLGLAAHVSARVRLGDAVAGFTLRAPDATAWSAIVVLGMLALAAGRMGLRARASWPRWFGLAVTFAVAATLAVPGRLFESETAQVLLALGVGLESAVRTAERRAAAEGIALDGTPLPDAPLPLQRHGRRPGRNAPSSRSPRRGAGASSREAA